MQATKVLWSLELCTRNEAQYQLHGYAFLPGNEHYMYTTSLVFLDDDHNVYQVDTQRTERLDVACAHPREHFLNHTGFACKLMDGMLPEGKEYQVIIRLTHQFKPNSVIDIPTGETICL